MYFSKNVNIQCVRNYLKNHTYIDYTCNLLMIEKVLSMFLWTSNCHYENWSSQNRVKRIVRKWHLKYFWLNIIRYMHHIDRQFFHFNQFFNFWICYNAMKIWKYFLFFFVLEKKKFFIFFRWQKKKKKVTFDVMYWNIFNIKYCAYWVLNTF